MKITNSLKSQNMTKISLFRRAIYFASFFNVISSYKTLEFVSLNSEPAKSLGIVSFPFSFMELIAPHSVGLMYLYCTFLLFLIVTGHSARYLTLAVIFLTFIINSFTLPVLDGGNNLVFLMLIYLLIPNEAKQEKLEKELASAFYTLSYFQLSIMYFVSSIYKIQTQSWVGGEALFNVLMSIEYSTPLVSKIVWWMPPDIFVVSNYAVILFQLTFFVGIISLRTKYLYLLFGIVMHFGIGLIVGLPTFALSVLVCYIQFLPESAFGDFKKCRKLKWLLSLRQWGDAYQRKEG